ncbi:MAG: hypothetical protein KatS3mg095_0502 [Candidatus Parcubacteria bacterium]|nr:MAG: hypothetical protein KatS3mg095_0502 [Candidatus Parcubacteria bacterium]
MAGFNQYHEPPEELSSELRDFARIIASLTEEAEAINWYQQRIAVTKDQEVKAIMQHAQEEEFEHFAIDLEWLSRKLPKWREVLRSILFKDGDILENAEKWEKER